MYQCYRLDCTLSVKAYGLKVILITGSSVCHKILLVLNKPNCKLNISCTAGVARFACAQALVYTNLMPMLQAIPLILVRGRTTTQQQQERVTSIPHGACIIRKGGKSQWKLRQQLRQKSLQQQLQGRRLSRRHHQL